MDCTTYREQIAAHVDDALGVEEAGAARAHLAECSHCSAKYRWERAVKAPLKEKLPTLEPSPFLKQRILAGLDDTKAARSLWDFSLLLRVMAGAAIVLFLFVPYYLLREGGKQADLFSSVVASYQEVRDGARGEGASLSSSAMLLDLTPWGYRLLSRSTAAVHGQPARISVYEGDGRTYLVAQEFEDSNISIPEGTRVVDDGANSFFTYERGGVNLIAWRERGVLCVIASSQSESDLLALAKRVIIRG